MDGVQSLSLAVFYCRPNGIVSGIDNTTREPSAKGFREWSSTTVHFLYRWTSSATLAQKDSGASNLSE